MMEVEEPMETGLEIAVIGMAGRFPGARNTREFWRNLKKGVHSISFLNEDELAAIDPELRKNPNFVKTKGGELEEFDYFDAFFFNYTPDEAELMAPSMRVFHECAWEALEDSGYDPGQYRGGIGLYAGIQSTSEWEALSASSALGKEVGAFTAAGLSNRDFMGTLIAYRLNLKGPVFSVNTACSTSLAAIHLACQGLLSGDCRMALAGGVSVRYPRPAGYLYEEGMISSPDGYTRTFDAAAGGTTGGDGTGAVVLKLLKNAAAVGDYIYAVIKGSAINNDGNRKVGYTAPSIEGQAEVIRQTYKIAEINPEDIGYIEAHGTATPLGDITELEALKIAFNTDKKHFCRIGSVKTNLGHLDIAAGVAGFIKIVLMLKHKQIPPNLHFQKPNPAIDFENSPFYINTTLETWENNGKPLRAGVSAFGIGGTNAHVVLEEWPGAGETVGQLVSGSVRMHSEGTRGLAPLSNRQYQLILLSAQTPTALDRMTENLGQYLKENPGANLADVAYTLQTGRKHYPCRRKLLGAAIQDTSAKLCSGDSRSLQTYRVMENEGGRKVIFMFPGLGPQYVNMGLDLYRREPVFREEMDRCFEILEPMLDYNLKEILYPALNNRSYRTNKTGNLDIHRIHIAQAAVFTFEYALARLIMTWGIRPHAMIGYSFGEYTAACISGVFNPADILRLLVVRGKLISQLPPGMMLSVPLPVNEVKPLLRDELAVAIDNGSSCVVSGPAAAVKEFEKEIKKKKIISMPLDAAHAIHSPMMDPILEQFTAEAAKISLKSPQIPYISTVTGNWIKVEDAVSPKYWARQLRETVCFARGIQNLGRESDTIFLEVGPGRDISALVEREINENGENADTPKNPVIHLVRQPKKAVPDDYYLLDKIGLLWLYGVKIDWQAYYTHEKRRRLPLPTYPFDKHRFWRLPEQQKTGTAVKQDLSQDRDLTDCFWVPSWKQTVSPLALSTDTPEKENKTNSHYRLVFLDKNEKRYRGRFAVNLVNRLKQKGCQVITAAQGETFSHEGDGEDHHYIINPNREEDYQALIRDICTRGMEKFPDMIIHLWILGTDEAAPGGKDYFQQRQVEGYYSLLYLAQALIKQRVGRNLLDIDENSLFLRIEIVSDHLHAVSGEDEIHAEKAPITGLCKTIPQEYPNITCRSLDIKVPAGGTPEEARLIDRIMVEFTHPTRDLTVAYRGNTRWVKFYEPFRLEPVTGHPVLLRRKGVYLITGGLGNDSFIRARYLAETFQARLVLTGRTPLPERNYWSQHLMLNDDQDPVSIKIKRIQELENLGAEVIAPEADAADEIDMHLVMQQAEQRFGALNGVIHAAGITDIDMSQLVLELGREQSERHFQPKVYGLYVLDKILAGRKLDFCLLTSSIAAAIAGIGFSAYTAANIFMDAFAQQKNNNCGSFPWIALNWFGTGPEETVEAFKRVLSVHGVEQVVFSQLDLLQLIRQRIDLKSLDGKARQSRGREGDKPVPLYERPALSTPYTAPRNAAEQKLAEIWQRFFGIDKIGVTDDIFDLGGDSLKTFNILAIVQKELNCSIPLKEFFDNPTIEEAAKYIEYTEPADGTGSGAYVSIEVAEKKEYYVLSSVQRRMFLFQKMNPGSTAYNSPMVETLEGDIDIEKLEQTFKKLIERHETLRASIISSAEQPVQRIHDRVEFEMEIFRAGDPGSSGSGFSQGRPVRSPGQTEQTIIKSFVRPFDLAKAPLLRVGLIKLPGTPYDLRGQPSPQGKGDAYLLLVDMHHIICDGISMGVVIKEFMALYEGRELPQTRLHYKDYAQWETRRQDEIKRQESYWISEFGEFADEIPVLELPLDYMRPGDKGFAGSAISFELDGNDTRALNNLALQRGVTLYMVLLAVYNIFLTKISGQEVVIVGTPTAGRRHPDLQQVIGMFVNTLALKNVPGPEKNLRSFLEEVKKNTINAFANQDYQYEDLVEKVMHHRDASRNPLFDTMFILQNLETPTMEIPGMKLEPYPYERTTSKFDLTLICFQIDGHISCTLEYSTELFKQETVHRFANYLKKIAAAVPRDTEQQLMKIDMLPEEEKKQLVMDFNDTTAPYPDNKTIYQLFESQVDRNPDHPALVYEDQNLTFGCFDEGANRLAHYMKTVKGMREGDRAAVLMERSLQLIIVLMAVMKARGAYVPLDVTQPAERLRLVIEDAAVGVVVTQRKYIRKFAGMSTGPREIRRILPEEDARQEIKGYNAARPAPGNAGDPVYVMYTSGTSGIPKGVMVEHRTIVNTITWRKNNYEYAPGHVSLQVPPYFFDSSVTDIFTPLLGGARLVLIRDEQRTDLPALGRIIAKTSVSHFIVVPVFYIMMLEEMAAELKHIKMVCCAGDNFPHQLIKKHFERLPRVRIFNEYGPAENSVNATAYELKPGSPKALIGKPISNVKVYILDRNLSLSPLGVTGELCLAGSSLARGYLNSPALTAEKFDHDLWDLWDYQDKEVPFGRILNAFGEGGAHELPRIGAISSEKLLRGVQGGGFLEKSPPGRRRQKIYKTGDMGRWLPGGNLEFLGRADNQVKIRGIRIETGEIENRLTKHEDIKEAVVLALQTPGGDKYLCAYVLVTPANAGMTGLPGMGLETGIKAYLSQWLPGYMIPAYVVGLEKIPLTPNGKIDRSALPKPGIKTGESYTAPRDEVEEKLVKLWAEILGRGDLQTTGLPTAIGIDDNFFRLGGHSLKAAILAAALEKTFNVKVPLPEIFKRPIIRELAGYIKGADRLKYEGIRCVEKKEYYGLSSAQKRLHFLWQTDKESTAYNLPAILLLEGKLDKDKLEKSIRGLIRAHESLRTSSEVIGGAPVQRIHDEVEFKMEYCQVEVKVEEARSSINSKCFEGTRGLAPLPPETAARSSQPAATLINSSIRPFDISRAPLMRAGLMKLGEDKHILAIDMHHIIADGMSARVLTRDFSTLYAGKELPAIKLQYKDYAQRQNREKVSKRVRQQEEYWKKEYEGEIPVLELPGDYERPAVRDFAGSRINFEIDREIFADLKALTLETGTTLYMLLLALYTILLAKLSGQEDIVVGTPVAGRRHADLGNIIGMFVNTLAIRNYPTGEKTFIDFLEEVKEKTLNAFENQDSQYEDLVENVVLTRDISRNPLFDVMFALQNTGPGKIEIPGMKMAPYEYPNKTAKFDLSLTGTELEEKLSFTFEFRTKLFREATVKRFIAYYIKIIRAVLENTHRKISQIEIITEAEKKRILLDFNKTADYYPKDKTIHGLFQEQEEMTPDYTALLGPGYQVRQSSYRSHRSYMSYISITYRYLNQKSHELAGQLKQKGVGAGALVGIMLDRSIEMVIGIFGILKAGGAYLPIEPGGPPERIDYMLKDSNSRILLTTRKLQVEGNFKQPPGLPLPLMHIDTDPGLISGFEPPSSTSTLNCRMSPANLAYVIYTSGSTGWPKGVAVEHTQVVNFLNHMYNRYDGEVGVNDRCLGITSIMFDVSIWELFLPLTFGAGLNLLPEKEIFDAQILAEAIDRQQITLVYLPPALLEEICRRLKARPGPIRLNKMLVGVEPIRDEVLEGYKQLNPRMKIINGYGPTETTVCASSYDYCSRPPRGEIVPIGVPLSNNQILLLDGGDRVVPVGIPGEICISGEGVTRGYLNRPQLTAEKYTPHPYFSGKRMYRTGDLARWLEDGNIRFLGRKDQQIKIRGHRIELGEIAGRLKTHPRIKEAVVIQRQDSERKYLCAYYTTPDTADAGHGPGQTTGRENISAHQLKEYLEGTLPGYMVPACYVKLDRIPLNASGKIHRPRLPRPLESDIPVTDIYRAPVTRVQRPITKIWQQILGREKIGIRDNFFQLGGNSLDLVTVSNQLREKLGKEVPVAALFTHPVVEDLARYLTALELPGTSITVPANFVMLNGHPRATGNIFFIHEILGDVGAYMEFCKQLETRYNCWGVEAEKLRNYAPRHVTIEEISTKYIQQIKRLQPQGPYNLFTWSWGGHLGLEMALQLERMGETLSLLAFVDCLGPDYRENNRPPQFTLENEKKFLEKFSTAAVNQGKLEKINDMEQLWSSAVRVLTGDVVLVEELRRLMIENALALPDYDELSGEELVQYLNLNRIHAQAGVRYKPAGKIQTPLHYFWANQNRARVETWKDYCYHPVVYHEIEGDHHSIFRDKEQIAGFARVFKKVISRVWDNTVKNKKRRF
jgi:amino acid adenylation domain-containing protein